MLILCVRRQFFWLWARQAAVRDAAAALDLTTFYGSIRFDNRGRNVAKEMGTKASFSICRARLTNLESVHDFSHRPSPTRRGRPSVAGVGAAGRNRLPDRPAVGGGLRAPVERRPRRPAVALPALVGRRRNRVMRRCVRVNRHRRAGSWTSCTRKSPGPRSAAARSARAPRTASAGNHQISNHAP